MPTPNQEEIFRLLDHLSQKIEGASRFGPFMVGLNRDEISMQIAKIRTQLVHEFRADESPTMEPDEF